MRKFTIAAILLGSGVSSALAFAGAAAAADAAVGKEVYAMVEVEERQPIGTIVLANANAFSVRIGDRCIGLPRQEFAESDGMFRSPWLKEDLEKTMANESATNFTCPEPGNASDPAVGRQVFAIKAKKVKDVVGTIQQADANAIRIRIGDQCIGMPRENFTARDGGFESPWSRQSIEETMKSGNPDDFVCPA